MKPNGYAYAVVAELREMNYQFLTNIDMKNESNNNLQNEAMPYDAMLAAGLFKGGLMYHCYHKPTKEHWCIIGISTDLKKVCAAGWPPSIADMKDCEDWELHGKLSEKEIAYREKEFGGGWL